MKPKAWINLFYPGLYSFSILYPPKKTPDFSPNLLYGVGYHLEIIVNDTLGVLMDENILEEPVFVF